MFGRSRFSITILQGFGEMGAKSPRIVSIVRTYEISSVWSDLRFCDGKGRLIHVCSD